jgi:hypothetical protein
MELQTRKLAAVRRGQFEGDGKYLSLRQRNRLDNSPLINGRSCPNALAQRRPESPDFSWRGLHHRRCPQSVGLMSFNTRSAGIRNARLLSECEGSFRIYRGYSAYPKTLALYPTARLTGKRGRLVQDGLA